MARRNQQWHPEVERQPAAAGRRGDAESGGTTPATASSPECRYLVGENQYFDAKAKLDQQAPLLERHLKDRRLDALTLADSLAILELGRICSLVGQYDQGREYALLGLQAQARLSAANPLLVGNLIQAELVVANVLARGHNPHEALPHAQKALSLCQEKKRFFTSAWQTELEGCARLTLAEVYQATGAFNASLAEVEQALVVLHQRFPPGEDYPKGHLLLANALQTQASTLVLLGRSVEARHIQEKALTQLENHLRPGHPTRAQAYLNMTALALLQGDPHLAGIALNEASRELAICFPEKLFPEGHPVLFQLCNTQANLDNQMGKAKEALQPLEDNWQKCQKFYKKPHGEKVLTLLAYAAGLRQADQFEKALAAAQQSLTLAADLPKSWPCDRYRSLCLVQIGDVLAALKRYDEALDSLAQAEKLQPKDNPEQPTILSCRALDRFATAKLCPRRTSFSNSWPHNSRRSISSVPLPRRRRLSPFPGVCMPPWMGSFPPADICPRRGHKSMLRSGSARAS